MEVARHEIVAAVEKAIDCQAWPVAIMLARILDDEAAINECADKLVERIKWNIPVTDRTPERLAEERQKILSKY